MRLKISNSKNTRIYYVIKTIYVEGKQKTVTVERIGNETEVIQKANGKDPKTWALNYIEELNKLEKENNMKILIEKSTSTLISKGKQSLFNCGYLFLESIYYELELNKICEKICKRRKFQYDLNDILSKLIFTRILYLASKLATNELSKKFIEQPKFDLHQIYRALEVLAKETDFIQSELYSNSLKISKRNTGILYYDCTNYFFETNQGDGFREEGLSKENRTTPIVQMGLFMDGDGIPLAFNMNPGNTNEQVTMTPTEEKILKDFNLSKFIVCTDAGLASNANRKFNDKQDRAFITTQSIKKLKKHIMDWALDKEGWKLGKSKKVYNLDEIEKEFEKHKENVFYKERWINENGLEQKLIVTFSLKYKNYQRRIREEQISKAKNAVEKGSSKLEKCKKSDYKRFVSKTNVTTDGEIAEKSIYSINYTQIEKEEKFDGFYGVCTNLEDDATEIIRLNKRRWEIEECFRIMKSEFKARPVFLKREDRIRAHFLTCFLALVIYRYLEKKTNEKFTCSNLIDTIREMNLHKASELGYIPTYTRTEITDELHEKFGFRTDNEITTLKNIEKIFKNIKK